MKPRILQIISTSTDVAGLPVCATTNRPYSARCPSAPGLPSSAEKQLCLLSEGLPRDQFEVRICVIGNTRQCDPQAFWQLKRLIDRIEPDLIHAWTPIANVYGLAAAKAAGAKCFIASYRSVDHWISSLQLVIDRYVGKHSAQLVTNSPAVRDFHAGKGLPPEKFQVIPDAVQSPRPSTFTRRQLLAELGLPENSRLIGLITRLLPRSRVKDAIWAADLIKVIRRDAHLLVIGAGPHFSRLRMFRDQVRNADLVHFLGERNDIARLLPHFDLLWSTSASEVQTSAILEAMAAGVPVVAVDTPVTRNLVVHQQTGLLAPVGDRTGFAAAAHQLFEDPAMARGLGQAGQEFVLREFTVDKMIAGYMEMYRQVWNN